MDSAVRADDMHGKGGNVVPGAIRVSHRRPDTGTTERRLPDPAVWEEAVMRQALADQDIGTVYRLLGRLGFSQQRIAGLTGQGQSEVSAIIHGRRVISYQVLSRIAEGLGIPRGYLGLSWCACAVEGGAASGGPVGADAF
jgi:Helix-turn-helix